MAGQFDLVRGLDRPPGKAVFDAVADLSGWAQTSLVNEAGMFEGEHPCHFPILQRWVR